MYERLSHSLQRNLEILIFIAIFFVFFFKFPGSFHLIYGVQQGGRKYVLWESPQPPHLLADTARD